MSLQAKIEAVIYASEEPVTLPQLMGLLGEEAQAELDALDSQQGSLSLALESPEDDDPAGEASGDEDALNAELLDNPGLGEPETAEQPPSEKPGLEAQVSETEQPPAAAELPLVEENQTGKAAGAAPASADEKKQARERERRLREYFRSLLDRLTAEYASSDRGLEIREVAGGFRMATKPEYHDAVRGFVKSLKPALKLSLQALETLAVIAYKQPVTAPEISEIRGVESGGVLGTLMARKLIATAGRKTVIGRPMLYKTTKEFLLRFGLKDINELPSIEEFERMAGELAEPVQEEIPMSDEADQGLAEPDEEGTAERDLPPVAELDPAPGASDVAQTADEVVSPRSRANAGAENEPSSGLSISASDSVEPLRNVHEAQADGVPDDSDDNRTPTAEAQDNPGDDAIVDGRISGLPPRQDVDEIDNPSAQEAAEQAAAGDE